MTSATCSRLLLVELPTVLSGRKPGTRLTNDRLSPVMVRRSDARLLRRLNRSAATARRAAEPGTDKTNARVVGKLMAP